MSQPKRARLQVDERRAQLLDLALELFADRTYDEISIGEIAAAAGVSKGLLYHYFSSKRAFYVAAVNQAARRLLEATEPAEDEPEPLGAGLHAYLDYVERHDAAYAFLLRGGVGADPEVLELIETTRRRFVDRIVDGLGEPDHEMLRLAIRGWLGFVEGASLGWLDGGKSVPREALWLLMLEQCRAAATHALGRPVT